MKRFFVEFKHVEETTYAGWVEADSQEEAYDLVESEPFDIQDLEDIESQGIEVIDIHVEEA